MTGPPSEQPPELINLPILLIALLRFSDFGVQLHRARGGSSIWYFRFPPGGVLEVGDDGHWSWRRGSERWRRQIAPFIARAEAMLKDTRPIGASTSVMLRARRKSPSHDG